LLRLLETGRVDPTPLTTHRFRFDQIETAFQMMAMTCSPKTSPTEM